MMQERDLQLLIVEQQWWQGVGCYCLLERLRKSPSELLLLLQLDEKE